MQASVIIPTYNRSDAVLRALSSLAKQTILHGGHTHDDNNRNRDDRNEDYSFEVIVVDDGSTYAPEIVSAQSYPFPFRYVRKENQGATLARNHGALLSNGEVLIFMDDDVTADAHTVCRLVQASLQYGRTMVMGNLIDLRPDEQAVSAPESGAATGAEDRTLHFSWTNTQLIAIRRYDFFSLGMLQDPTGGWPNWDDVDIGYRAHLAGYSLLLCGEATGIHWDHSLSSLTSACQRWQRASKSAVRLFQRYPDLAMHIPMFYDKTPIDWEHDAAWLVARKLTRKAASTEFAIRILKQAVSYIENISPSSPLAARLSLWVQGACMYRGFQDGLREYGPLRLTD